MKKFSIGFLLVICVFVFINSLFAQRVDQQIMFYLFNAQLGQADSLIELQIKQNPENPKYYFLKAHFNFYQRYFAQQNFDRDSILQVIIDVAQKAVDLKDKVELSTENKFYIGSAYGLKCRAHVLKGELWSGYWAGRDCRNYLWEVLEEDSSFYDAYVGLGVIEYYTGRLTGFQSFLAWLGGMSGDRDKGLEFFDKTADKGDLLKDEATFILATLYRFFENDFTQADVYLSRLNEKFPNNNFINNIYRQARLSQLIEDKGIKYLETGIDTLREKYNITSSGVLNGLGYSYMGQQRYDLAVAVFLLNIKLYPEEANPYDSISECYQVQGENELSIEYARMSLQKLPADTTINEDFRDTLREILETRLDDLGAEEVPPPVEDVGSNV
jgi:hypothetical protein